MAQAVHFSVTHDAAWASGVETREAWLAWSHGQMSITGGGESRVLAMPPMQRRRAGPLGKMALETAFACLGERVGVPTVFCSRHGEVSRSVDLLTDLAMGEPLSPAAFGLSVHNGIAGLFSIVRGDRVNQVAISAGDSTIEHGVIEACGLLADGEQAVLLVAYDCALPDAYADFRDAREQPYAWAWLLEPARGEHFSLGWTAGADDGAGTGDTPVAGLDILRFYLGGENEMRRARDGQIWHWSRHA